MENKNNSRVPKLRFPGFKGDWEENKLGEVATSYSGGTPKTGDPRYYGGNIPFIRSGEIHGDKTELFITEDGLNNSSAKLIKKGDLLIALYGATSGEVAISKIDGAINQAILCIQSDKIDSCFLCNYLEREKDHITSRFLQGGQGNLSSDIIMSLQIPFPTLAEQQKIAECLTEVDEMISGQSEKVESLKAHKKGLMQQLFPQPGETAPRLRFPGFKGNWVEKKLGEVFEKINNGANYNTYLTEGYPMSRIETISTGKIDYNHVGYSDIEPDPKYKLETGDILFSHINSESRIGRVARYNGEQPLYHGMNLLLLRASKSCDKDFSFYLMDREKMRKNIQRFAKKAINQASVSTADLKRVTVLIPESSLEQQKIAECLTEVDNNIEEESAKLESLKAHKKGLMQNLFPEPIK